MLHYSLVENLLTERTDDHSAQTHSMASLDKEAIITRMLKRGTSLTRTDIIAVMNSFEEVIEEILLDGYSITHPLFNTSFSISGVFDNPLDSFDGSRHRLNINLTKGLRLREVEQKVKFEKTNALSPQPNIQEVKDSVSGLVNEVLTSRGVVEIRGYNLKIEGDDPSCGLWFVRDGNEIKAEVLIENKPSRLLAMLPEFGEGNACQVKVVTQFANGVKLLKTPKSFVYPKSLQVR